MKSRNLISLFASLILLLLGGPVALAQTIPPAEEPFVQVGEQGVVDGRVFIVQAYADGPAWVVIHADADGKPGPVIGHAALQEGANREIVVEVDVDAVTPLLHAMLHVDEGVVGTYEFPGPDVPMTIGENIVMAMFSAAPPEAPEADAEAEAEAAEATETPVAEEEAEAEAMATPEAEEETAEAATETEAAAETPAPDEESAEESAAAEAAPTETPEAEEEAEAEAATEAEAAAETPVAEEEAAAEAEAAEAEATPVAEEEVAEEGVAEEEAEAAQAMAAPAEAKGAEPTSLPTTGAGAPLPLILGALGVVVSALGGSVFFSRRR